MKVPLHEEKIVNLESKLQRIMRFISWVTITPCAVAVAGWVAVIVAYIVAREFFDVTWVFVEEFTGYWLMAIGFFSLTYALATRGHITVLFVVQRLSPMARSIMQVVSSSAAVVLGFYLSGRSIQWCLLLYERNVHSGSTLYVILWPAYSLVAIGLSFFTIGLTIELCLSILELMKVRQNVGAKEG